MLFVGTVQTENCGVVLTTRTDYYGTGEIFWVHEDAVGYEETVVPIFNSYAFAALAVSNSVIKDPSVNDAVNIEKVFKSGDGDYVKINEHFIYRNKLIGVDPSSPPWHVMHADGSIHACPNEPPPPSPSPCVADHSCYDALDEMHSVSTCADILNIGVLSCDSPDIKDNALCDYSCGVCTRPENLCESPPPASPSIPPAGPSEPSPPGHPPCPPTQPPPPRPPPSPPLLPQPTPPPTTPPPSPPPP